MIPQILNVEGPGVIKVTYISEIAFCDRPLINPKAPKVLTPNVTTKNRALSKAFFVLSM
jgi:hypothetical protein